jgi:hypothetical protein
MSVPRVVWPDLQYLPCRPTDTVDSEIQVTWRPRATPRHFSTHAQQRMPCLYPLKGTTLELGPYREQKTLVAGQRRGVCRLSPGLHRTSRQLL